MLLLGEMDLALEFFQTHVFYIQTEIGAFFILAILLLSAHVEILYETTGVTGRWTNDRFAGGRDSADPF